MPVTIRNRVTGSTARYWNGRSWVIAISTVIAAAKIETLRPTAPWRRPARAVAVVVRTPPAHTHPIVLKIASWAATVSGSTSSALRSAWNISVEMPPPTSVNADTSNMPAAATSGSRLPAGV
jgi:hypothetical protein